MFNSLLERIRALIAGHHETGYANELPNSVTSVLEHIAEDVDALRDQVGTGSALPADLELRECLAGRVQAIEDAVAKIEDHLQGSVVVAHGALADAGQAGGATPAFPLAAVEKSTAGPDVAGAEPAAVVEQPSEAAPQAAPQPAG